MNITIITLIMAVLISAMAAYIITDKTSAGEKYKALAERARLEAVCDDLGKQLAGLDKDGILHCLTDDLGLDAKMDPDGDILFSHLGANYAIMTGRLPQISIAKTFDLKDSDLDWDLMQEAADRATDSVVMVKFRVIPKEDLSAYVVAYEQTMAGFKANIFRYLEIIEKAMEEHASHYRNRSEGYQELPDEQMPDAPKILS